MHNKMSINGKHAHNKEKHAHFKPSYTFCLSVRLISYIYLIIFIIYFSKKCLKSLPKIERRAGLMMGLSCPSSSALPLRVPENSLRI